MSLKRLLIFTVVLVLLAIVAMQWVSLPNEATQHKASLKTEDNDVSDAQLALHQKVNSENITPSNIGNDHTPEQQTSDVQLYECLPDLSFFHNYMDKRSEDEITRDKQYIESLEPFEYALVAELKEGQTRLDLLFDYHQQDSHPLISLDMLALCSKGKDDRCTPNLINELVATDKDNGAIWLNAIYYHIAKGNDDAVYSAIDSLAKTTHFNERYGEHGLLYAQALDGSGIGNFQMNVANGLSRAVIGNFSALNSWCEQTENETKKADACLTLGKQLEKRAASAISQGIGATLQIRVHEAQGNIEAADLVSSRRNKRYSLYSQDYTTKAFLMLLLDEELTRAWIENIDAYGEHQALQFLTQDAESLYERGEQFICDKTKQVLDSLM